MGHCIHGQTGLCIKAGIECYQGGMYKKNNKLVSQRIYIACNNDVAKFSKGNGYSESDLVEDGTPIILYGRLYTNYETTIKNVDTFVVEKENSIFSKGGEGVVPASGETAEDIARASVIENAGGAWW